MPQRIIGDRKTICKLTPGCSAQWPARKGLCHAHRVQISTIQMQLYSTTKRRCGNDSLLASLLCTRCSSIDSTWILGASGRLQTLHEFRPIFQETRHVGDLPELNCGNLITGARSDRGISYDVHGLHSRKSGDTQVLKCSSAQVLAR